MLGIRYRNEIISDDACTVAFDPGGHLIARVCPDRCLFEDGLETVLQSACPKKYPR